MSKKTLIILPVAVMTVVSVASLVFTFTLYQQVRSEKALLKAVQAQSQTDEEPVEEFLRVSGKVASLSSDTVAIEGEGFSGVEFTYNAETLFYAGAEVAEDNGVPGADFFQFPTMEELSLKVGDTVEIVFSSLDQGGKKYAIEITKI